MRCQSGRRPPRHGPMSGTQPAATDRFVRAAARLGRRAGRGVEGAGSRRPARQARRPALGRPASGASARGPGAGAVRAGGRCGLGNPRSCAGLTGRSSGLVTSSRPPALAARCPGLGRGGWVPFEGWIFVFQPQKRWRPTGRARARGGGRRGGGAGPGRGAALLLNVRSRDRRTLTAFYFLNLMPTLCPCPRLQLGPPPSNLQALMSLKKDKVTGLRADEGS